MLMGKTVQEVPFLQEQEHNTPSSPWALCLGPVVQPTNQPVVLTHFLASFVLTRNCVAFVMM